MFLVSRMGIWIWKSLHFFLLSDDLILEKLKLEVEMIVFYCLDDRQRQR